MNESGHCESLFIFSGRGGGGALKCNFFRPFFREKNYAHSAPNGINTVNEKLFQSHTLNYIKKILIVIKVIKKLADAIYAFKVKIRIKYVILLFHV